MFYTYVIKSKKNGKFYTGFTGDLKRRISQHNNNQSTYTRNRGPFELIYYEACLNEEDARSREIYLKSGMGKRYLSNRIKIYTASLYGSR
ncbi:MAG: GIY-YIG nuclease family protein [Candidatus Paceibacterota bacterium]|jgi:putative endonuclease